MSTEDEQVGAAAAELTTAMTRLRARLRSESAPEEMPWTWSQLSTVSRLVKEGPSTASALAQAEHVRRQSMAETLEALRGLGLIVTEKDPDDGRKTLISASDEARVLFTTMPAAREAWLAEAMRRLLRPEEQRVLRQAAEIMNRIADAQF
jgi:DNA-binding MarR family transcriptional regulator